MLIRILFAPISKLRIIKIYYYLLKISSVNNGWNHHWESAVQRKAIGFDKQEIQLVGGWPTSWPHRGAAPAFSQASDQAVVIPLPERPPLGEQKKITILKITYFSVPSSSDHHFVRCLRVVWLQFSPSMVFLLEQGPQRILV